jgi:hypothetical protein
MRFPSVVLLSGKNDKEDSVSKSDDETEEKLGVDILIELMSPPLMASIMCTLKLSVSSPRGHPAWSAPPCEKIPHEKLIHSPGTTELHQMNLRDRKKKLQTADPHREFLSFAM